MLIMEMAYRDWVGLSCCEYHKIENKFVIRGYIIIIMEKHITQLFTVTKRGSVPSISKPEAQVEKTLDIE